MVRFMSAVSARSDGLKRCFSPPIQVVISDWFPCVSGGTAMRFRPLFALLFSLVIPAVASAQWVATGVPVSAIQNDQRVIAMCSDGAGGVIMAWEDYRIDVGSDVYAQR